MIIQIILEGLLRVNKNTEKQRGIVKSQLIRYSALKTATAEKYLSKMEKAEYIRSREEWWGERKITVYEITQKGQERYQWFVKINTEME